MITPAFRKHHRNSVEDYVALDIETLGVQQASKVLSIGLVRVRDGEKVQELELFPSGWELWEIPHHHPTDHSLLAQMHRTSRAHNMSMAQVLGLMNEFLQDDVIVGQNIARFDLPVLDGWLNRHRLQPLGNTYVDLLPLARRTYPQLPNHKLETLTRHHNLGHVAHTALSDAVQEHLLYERMKPDMAGAPATPSARWRKPSPIANVIAAVGEVEQTPLTGARICVTGEFNGRTREEIWAQLAAWGAEPLASLSAQTDYLLVGDWGAGPKKLQVAAERGIEVITWARLQSLLGS